MTNHSEAFVAFDTSKLRNAVAIADAGRAGEVRFLGEIDNTAAATAKLVRKLAVKYERLTFCYEAAPCPEFERPYPRAVRRSESPRARPLCTTSASKPDP